jgi:hypothetical protein
MNFDMFRDYKINVSQLIGDPLDKYIYLLIAINVFTQTKIKELAQK